MPSASNITIWNSQSSTTVGHPVGFVLGYPPAGRCEVMEADWQVSMSANIQQGDFPCGQDNGTSKNIFFLNAGTANVKARVQNVCGWSDWSTRVPIQVNSSLFKVAPNPATNTITVKGKDITELKIFDNMGNLKKQLKYKANLQQFQVNVSDLQMGIYIIEATSGQDKERQQFIIQK